MGRKRGFIVSQLLVLAAERITTAMTICRPTARTTQVSVSQLVIAPAVPDEDVTAKNLWNLRTVFGWTINNQTVSSALHSAATHGISQHRRPGVYLRVTQNNRSQGGRQLVQLTEQPSAQTRREEGSHGNAVAQSEEDPR